MTAMLGCYHFAHWYTGYMLCQVNSDSYSQGFVFKHLLGSFVFCVSSYLFSQITNTKTICSGWESCYMFL